MSERGMGYEKIGVWMSVEERLFFYS